MSDQVSIISDKLKVCSQCAYMALVMCADLSHNGEEVGFSVGMLCKYRFSFPSHFCFNAQFRHEPHQFFVCLFFVLFFFANQKHHSLISRSLREKHYSTSGVLDHASVFPSSPSGVKPSVSDTALALLVPDVSLLDVVSFNTTQKPHCFYAMLLLCKYLCAVLLLRRQKVRALKVSSPRILEEVDTALTPSPMDLMPPPKRRTSSGLLLPGVKVRASRAPSKCLSQRKKHCKFCCCITISGMKKRLTEAMLLLASVLM